MAIANNHPERVIGLVHMALAECSNDKVAAFAALADAAACIASIEGIPPKTARDRISETMRKTIYSVAGKRGE